MNSLAQAIEILRWKKVQRWGLTLAEFGATQIAVQALTAMAGILIIRSMSKPDYALFAIANSMQTTCNLLADLGIGVGLRSIGGRVWNDRFRFGQLLNTAFELRWRFAFVSFGLCLPITAWMMRRNGASTTVAIVLCFVVVVGATPLLASSIWRYSPWLHGEHRRIQKLDLGNAALRLTIIGTLTMAWMNATLALLAGAIGNWIQATFLRYWARDHANNMAPINKDDQRELIRLSLKSFPNVVFFCFQGQVTLLILSLIGNSTGIADVSALGRIAALFGVFSVTFANVLVPKFARCQEPKRLTQLYFLLIGGTVFVLLSLSICVWFYPQPFLWLLGRKYITLEPECRLVVVTGCIEQMAGVMWGLNSSKAWIRIQSSLFVPTILVSQVVAASCLDLLSFHSVLVFNLVTAASPILIYVIDAYLGLQSTWSMASLKYSGIK